MSDYPILSLGALLGLIFGTILGAWIGIYDALKQTRRKGKE